MSFAKIKDIKSEIITRLLLISKENTFLTFDDILNVISKAKLPLDELDRVCESLLDQGVFIQQEASEIELDEVVDSVFTDRSHLNYNEIFYRVVKIDSTLKDYISDLQKIPSPRPNEEKILFFEAIDGNSYAKNRIISMFLKIVVRIALWYHDNYSLPLKDTIQDGNVGLLLALEKMPKSPDYRFSAYAPWWIRQNIERSASLGFCDSFYVPGYIKSKLFKLISLKNSHHCDLCFFQQTECPNFIKEVSEQLNVDHATVLFYLTLLEEPISIDGQLNKLYEDDFFSDRGGFDDDLCVLIDQKSSTQTFTEIISELKTREVNVIMRRYGFGNYGPMTLEEISKDFGVTRERIRQIENKALEKIKRTMNNKNHVLTVSDFLKNK